MKKMKNISQDDASRSTVERAIESMKKSLTIRQLILCLSVLSAIPAQAETHWVSATLDNDFFVNEDNGYTNGIYVSLYDVYDDVIALPKPDAWVMPLAWSLSHENIGQAVNVYSFGQSLTTPSDLTLSNPPKDSLPYSGLISFTNTYVVVSPNYADKVSTTLGIVGPIALGKQTQKTIHKIISAQEPMGWDTQLENELVFQFSRGRTWRSWVSESNNMDVLTGIEGGLGTLKSEVGAGFMLRYGRNLNESFPTVLLTDTRASNPLAVNRGWFVYAGLKFDYTFNQIFTDGNTFRNSRSIDYDHNNNMFTSGLTYAWDEASLSFAINSPFSLNGRKNAREMDKLTRYGTLTFAWQL
ncbi:lipid A deacylase LpxR family protein [Marinomonas posidonica]|uniref:lipid A deacylase LpxR family protein n=1 Tax=Marinomonas posidonica TaxID=936476 RepID=UPI00373529CF